MNIHRGHLYIADLNPPLGTEAGKRRPVVIIQSDLLNETGHPSTWVLPCTTQLSLENILRVRLPKSCAGNAQDCEVMIDQSRAIDNQRLKKHSGEIPGPLFEEIMDKLKLVAGI